MRKNRRVQIIEPKVKANCAQCKCRTCLNICATECRRCKKKTGGYVGFCIRYQETRQQELRWSE